MNLIELVVKIRHCSKSEASRLIEQGAVQKKEQNGWEKLTDKFSLVWKSGVYKVGRNFLEIEKIKFKSIPDETDKNGVIWKGVQII